MSLHSPALSPPPRSGGLGANTAKPPHSTAPKQFLVSSKGRTHVTTHFEGCPCCHLARRDMVLSLGHIHRSEEPPSTASVIAGHPGTGLGTPEPAGRHPPSTAGTSVTLLPKPVKKWSFQPGCRGKMRKKSLKITPGKGFICGIKRVWSRDGTLVTGC